MSVFHATSANGTWKLFVVDDTAVDSGTIAGWSLNISTPNGDYVASSGMITFNPGTLSQTIAVPVNGDVNNEPDETLFVNLTAPINATILDGQGQGTVVNDDNGIPPTNVVATATAPTIVNVTWTAAPGAASYRVYRSSDRVNYLLVGSPPTTPFNDNTAVSNTAYLYKVRSFSGGESADSNIDLATTIIFTDPTLTAGTTTVKLLHFTELLTAVNAVRMLAGLGAIAFAPPTPTTSVAVRRQHLLDLRSGIDATRIPIGMTALPYSEPTITTGSTTIKAIHITEVRNGVK
jgi:hypothetical protein